MVFNSQTGNSSGGFGFGFGQASNTQANDQTTNPFGSSQAISTGFGAFGSTGFPQQLQNSTFGQSGTFGSSSIVSTQPTSSGFGFAGMQSTSNAAPAFQASGFGFGSSVASNAAPGSIFQNVPSFGNPSASVTSQSGFQSFGTSAAASNPSNSTSEIKFNGSQSIVEKPAPQTEKRTEKLSIQDANQDLEAAKQEERQKRFDKKNNVSEIRDRMKKERDKREEEFYNNYKAVQLSEARALVGTCQQMCPEFEKYDREVTQELHLFEVIKGTENDPTPAADHSLCVKKYRRSAAGKDPEIFPEDIRPPPVLKYTMDYLINTIMLREDVEFVEIYNFIRDRGRAIRKDFKVQSHLKGPECVNVLERLTRFLIHADFELCHLPESQFSWKQNRHQIIDALTTLLEVYDGERSRGIVYPNEFEFKSYFILMMMEDKSALDRYQEWAPEIRTHPAVLFALKISRNFLNRFYHQFFKLLKSDRTSYLMACILNYSIPIVRSDTLRTFFAAMSPKDKVMPYELFMKLLCLDTEDEIPIICDTWNLVNDTFERGVKLGGNINEWIEPEENPGLSKSKMILDKASGKSPSQIVNEALLFDSKLDAPTQIIPLSSYRTEKPHEFAFGAPQAELKPAPFVLNSIATPPKVEHIVSKPKLAIDKKKIVAELSHVVLDEIMRESIHQLAESRVGFALKAGRTSKTLTGDLIGEVSTYVLKEVIQREKSLFSAMKVTLAELSAKIIEEVLKEMNVLSFMEIRAEEKYRNMVLLKHFSKWRNLQRQKKEKRLQMETRNKRNSLNIERFPLNFNSNAIVNGEEENLFRRSSIRQKLSNMVKHDYTNKSDEFDSRKLIKIIVEKFGLIKNDLPYVKIVVNDLFSFGKHGAFLTLNSWVTKCLTVGKSLQDYPQSPTKTLSFVEAKSGSSETVLVITQMLKASSYGAMITGASVALFHYYFDGRNQDIFKKSLVTFIKSFPDSTPLCIIYWTSDELSEAAFSVMDLVDLEILKKENNLAYVISQHLGSIPSCALADASKHLEASLCSLLEHVPKQPQLVVEPFVFFMNQTSQMILQTIERVAYLVARNGDLQKGLVKVIEVHNVSLKYFASWIKKTTKFSSYPPEEFLKYPDTPALRDKLIPPRNWVDKNLSTLKNISPAVIPHINDAESNQKYLYNVLLANDLNLGNWYHVSHEIIDGIEQNYEKTMDLFELVRILLYEKYEWKCKGLIGDLNTAFDLNLMQAELTLISTMALKRKNNRLSK